MADVVEGGDEVVERPDGIGQPEQVGRPYRQRLQLPHGVVAHEADGAPGKPGQLGDGGLIHAVEDVTESVEGGGIQRLDAVGRAVAG